MSRYANGASIIMLRLKFFSHFWCRPTIVIDQTDGPTPYRAIVEPRLPAGRIREASVDGAPAELDSAVVDGGMQVAVQLVVDQRRTLVLDYERR